MRFGGQTAIIQGRGSARPGGMYAKSSVCAVQVVWPVQAFEQLQASWSGEAPVRSSSTKMRSTAADRQRSAASAQTVERAAQQHPWKPYARGRGPSSSVSGSRGPEHWAAMYLGEDGVLGTLCLMDDEVMKCPSAVKSRLAGVLSRAGWQIVGSELAANNLAPVRRGPDVCGKRAAAGGAVHGGGEGRRPEAAQAQRLDALSRRSGFSLAR